MCLYICNFYVDAFQFSYVLRTPNPNIRMPERCSRIAHSTHSSSVFHFAFWVFFFSFDSRFHIFAIWIVCCTHSGSPGTIKNNQLYQHIDFVPWPLEAMKEICPRKKCEKSEISWYDSDRNKNPTCQCSHQPQNNFSSLENQKLNINWKFLLFNPILILFVQFHPHSVTAKRCRLRIDENYILIQHSITVALQLDSLNVLTHFKK